MLHYLQSLDWPGNIRELSNGIARHLLLGMETDTATAPRAHRSSEGSGDSSRAIGVPLKELAKEAVRAREKSFILDALRANKWNRRKTAEALKISYRTLIYKIRDSGLSSAHGRSARAWHPNGEEG
jgi:DNA-binding NtrC family response regulator